MASGLCLGGHHRDRYPPPAMNRIRLAAAALALAGATLGAGCSWREVARCHGPDEVTCQAEGCPPPCPPVLERVAGQLGLE